MSRFRRPIQLNFLNNDTLIMKSAKNDDWSEYYRFKVDYEALNIKQRNDEKGDEFNIKIINYKKIELQDDNHHIYIALTRLSKFTS